MPDSAGKDEENYILLVLLKSTRDFKTVSSTMPTTGPGTGSFKKWDSASPPDCMSRSKASPCSAFMVVRNAAGRGA